MILLWRKKKEKGNRGSSGIGSSKGESSRSFPTKSESDSDSSSVIRESPSGYNTMEESNWKGKGKETVNRDYKIPKSLSVPTYEVGESSKSNEFNPYLEGCSKWDENRYISETDYYNNYTASDRYNSNSNYKNVGTSTTDFNNYMTKQELNNKGGCLILTIIEV